MAEFNEVEIALLDNCRHYFTGFRLKMVIESILAGKAKARLFALQGSGQSLFLLWDQGNHVFYLAGDSSSPDSGRALKDLISSDIREWALSHNQCYFTFRDVSETVSPLLHGAFEDYITGEYEKAFYRYPRPHPLPDISIQDGPGLFTIDEKFLYHRGFGNLEPIRDEIEGMWPSIESYLSGGLGVAAVVNNSAVCWCTAEYVGPNLCGIGIETVEEMRNRGIATATAARFIDFSLERELLPHWECWTVNKPSVKVAGKLNFKLLETNLLRVGEFV